MTSSPIPARRRRGLLRIFAGRQSGTHAAPRSRHAEGQEPGQSPERSDAAVAAMHALEAAMRGNRYILVTHLTGLNTEDLTAAGRAGHMVSTFAAALIRSRREAGGRFDDAPVPPGFGLCLECLLRECGICRDPLCFHRHSWAAVQRPPAEDPAVADAAGAGKQAQVLVAATGPQSILPAEREACE